MTLRDMLKLARRWGVFCVLAAALAGTSAYFVTKRVTPAYRSSATLLVNQAQTPGVVTYQDILGSQQLTKTYAALATSNINLERAAAALGVSVGRLESSVSAGPIAGTQLIAVSAEDSDPATAASTQTRSHGSSSATSRRPSLWQHRDGNRQRAAQHRLRGRSRAARGRTPAAPPESRKLVLMSQSVTEPLSAVVVSTREYPSDRVLSSLLRLGFRAREIEYRPGMLDAIIRCRPSLVLLLIRPNDAIERRLIPRIAKLTAAPIVVLAPGLRQAGFVEAMREGADACLSEADGVEWLAAHAEAIIRRSLRVPDGAVTSADILEVGDLLVKFKRCEVTIRGKSVHLTPMEFRVCSALVQKSAQFSAHHRYSRR